jgi:hypothetical protein
LAKAISDEAIENGTSRSWPDWLAVLQSFNAEDLSHKEIAARLQADGELSGWWAQMLTVAFEQHIGRRVPGQDCSGSFSVAVSKTLPGTMDSALQRWQSRMHGVRGLSDVVLTRGPDTSQTEKWRYWRCGLADGSRVNVNIYQKSADKASLGIQHEKLESEAQVEHWRAFWKARVKDL